MRILPDVKDFRKVIDRKLNKYTRPNEYLKRHDQKIILIPNYRIIEIQSITFTSLNFYQISTLKPNKYPSELWYMDKSLEGGICKVLNFKRIYWNLIEIEGDKKN